MHGFDFCLFYLAHLHGSLYYDVTIACKSSTMAHSCCSLNDDLSIENTLFAAVEDGCKTELLFRTYNL